jgi:anti-sigma factor RsiW
MDCQDVRLRLLAYQRGQLDPAASDGVRVHLAACAGCAHEEAAERALTEALEARLPQHGAPVGLKRRLAAQWPSWPASAPIARRRWRRPLVAASAVAAALLIALPLALLLDRGSPSGEASMVAEAVNDHLRVLASQHPLDIESRGMHEVKPWFEGRLDFAPVLAFQGDEEFPLRGGAIGYFLGRKAAVLVFHRRLHQITLIVFPAEGLPWPTADPEPLGGGKGAHTRSARGFTVILWRRGELGYALVSDVDRGELTSLATKLAGAS